MWAMLLQVALPPYNAVRCALSTRPRMSYRRPPSAKVSVVDSPEFCIPSPIPLFFAVSHSLLRQLYFGKQACANYAVHYMLTLLNQDELIKARIEQRTSVTTGTEVMAWKDALSVPQRGS